ncbi:Fibrinogen-like protein 1 [Mactra antiquata]
MELKRTLQGTLLCLFIFLVYSEDTETKSSRRRRCRCKKYIEKISKDIDSRLQAFESRFEQYLTHSPNALSNVTSDLILDQNGLKIDSLTVDMNKTREILQKESYTLRQLKENMYTQEMSVDSLTENFKSLDFIVRNLTMVVEKLETSMRNKIDKAPRTMRHKPKRNKPELYPKDCDEVYQSGGMKYLGDYYIMVQPEKAKSPFKCVCKIIDGAGWTVIQRRQDGRENFSRNWEDYKNGFGDLQNEFWLGNEKIHQLTTQGDYKLKIDMEDMDGKKWYAEYDRFQVSDERDLYRLHVNGYHGTAGDSLTPYWRTHDGMPFSTRDRDNDKRFYDNCAEDYGGGWWYNDCYESHLNGKYYHNGSHNDYFVRNGIQWNSIHAYSSLNFVEIMIKPTDNTKLPNDI